MAGLTLKVTNRSPKQPIKKLPTSIELPNDASVEDVKKALAKATGTSDFNRLGIYDPATKKTLKDRNALLREQEGVIKTGEILVKDLGLQLAWRTVFLVEYFGPLLFHPIFLGLRNSFYPAVYPYLKDYVPAMHPELSLVQKLAFAMIMAHFVKREVETAFVHKFSTNTMPAWNIFRNSFFYWVSAGFLGALELYAPFSPSAWADDNKPRIYLGVALYLFGEIANARIHLYLAGLRKPGETARKLPSGASFRLVTCPNYMFEILAWIGIIIVTLSPAITMFICIGASYMYTWAWGKEKAYRKQFGDKYKKKRSVILPGLL